MTEVLAEVKKQEKELANDAAKDKIDSKTGSRDTEKKEWYKEQQ